MVPGSRPAATASATVPAAGFYGFAAWSKAVTSAPCAAPPRGRRLRAHRGRRANALPARGPRGPPQRSRPFQRQPRRHRAPGPRPAASPPHHQPRRHRGRPLLPDARRDPHGDRDLPRTARATPTRPGGARPRSPPSSAVPPLVFLSSLRIIRRSSLQFFVSLDSRERRARVHRSTWTHRGATSTGTSSAPSPTSSPARRGGPSARPRRPGASIRRAGAS